MTKHFHVLLWVPLLYAVLFFIFWVEIYQNDYVDFESYVLEKQANYAADSAIDELLASSNINTDYAEGDFVTLEPELAKDDFAHTMCLDFGYIPTDDTLSRVCNENIRTLLVCTYDGVYAYYMQQTETHSYELKQTPKIPYFYTADDGRQYCLTLGLDKGYWDYTDSNGNYKLHDYDAFSEDAANASNISDDVQLTAINNQIADILNWAMYETYADGKTDTTVSIPALGENVRGEQPVSTPAVIAVVDGNTKSFATYITAETIGGAQLEDTNHVIGYTLNTNYTYTRNGVTNTVTLKGKYYAYETFWASHSSLLDSASNGKYFDSVFDAAKSGYNDINLFE